MTDPEPGIAIEAPLSPAEDESDTVRHGLRRTQREIPPAELEVEAELTDLLAAHCRRAKRHEYIVWTRLGTRCLWCRRLRTWDPL